MSEGNFIERRKSPRAACSGAHSWKLTLRAPVRLLDISAGGALFASEVPVPLAEGGRLRVRFAGRPFEADATIVRRSHLGPAFKGYGRHELAAVFKSMDQRSRDAMEEFLRARMAGR
jgi:hypothetical protein